MENASEALRIAGGVLIGVLVLSLLVAFYYNISDWQKVDQNETYLEQVNKFNKEYDIYIRNIYGSELLSLANKAANYNKLESEEKGYSRFDVVVTFTTNLGGFKKGTTYKTDSIISIMTNLQNEIEKVGSKKYANYIVSQLALMRTNELEEFCTVKKLTSTQKTNLNNDIKEYTNLKADETTIKSKVFKYKDLSYDESTGRIKVIEYIEQ